MKRYIRASYDSSMPDWLKSEAGKRALGNLTDRYAISQAKFSRNPSDGGIPIHLLDDVYKEDTRWGETYKTKEGQHVFIPSMSWGSNDRYFDTGASYRSIPSAAKSRLKEHTIDTVYMTAPERKEFWEEREQYRDPRSLSYSRGGHPQYAGQYPEYDEHRNPETGEWEKDTEPSSWEVRRDWSGDRRDKSGYVIPNPEDLYDKLYQRFPDRLKGRIAEVQSVLDEYYDKLNEAKTAMFSQFDIRKGKTPFSRYAKPYETSTYYLDYAISDYGRLYQSFDKCIESNGSVNPSKLATFMKGTGYDCMPKLTKNIDDYLDKFYKKLG